ncbi:MAG: Omp28-related outer membrane protein [Saprospiraceae bacterium]|nr:Omp28-related outer membrane protein [Saprospiraceae bacterium]
MKKFLLIVLFAVSLVISNGQAKRYIFMEHVTNSNCGSCAASNPNYYNVIKPYQGNYHHLTIHPKFPYVSCVFYQANKPEQDERVAFLGVSSTPTVIVNGLIKKSASGITKAILDAEMAKTSPIEVIVKETGTTSRSVTVEVKTVGTKPAGTYKVVAAIAEKERNQTTSNGEKVHYDVFRKFLTAATGDAITLADNGSSVNLNYNYTVNSAWVESETYLLVWVQDVTTKEVLNSGNKFDVISKTEDLVPSDVKILYNPVRTNLSVQLNKNLDGGNYLIMNIMGQIVSQGIINTNNNKLEVPVAHYESGMYFLRIESNRQKITKRWIKESYNP